MIVLPEFARGPIWTPFIWMLLALLSVKVYSQDDLNKIHMIGRAQADAILIRIAPGSPALWELGNKYGYYVERFTVTRGAQFLGDKERKILTPSPLKPLPLEEWKTVVEKNDFAAIAAQSIYGETFELSTNFDQDIMQIYNKAKELESRFSFALFCADVSIDVAKASGLYLEDSDVEKGERYLYRVTSATPQSIISSDSAYVYISLDDHAPLPEIMDVRAEFSDRMCMLSWDTRHLGSFYTAYWIERSEDGVEFHRVSELPYVNLKSDKAFNQSTAYKIDSLDENDKRYYYRIIGISPFGELSKPSEVVSGEGVESIGSAPAIRNVELEGQQSVVSWEFDETREVAILGFEIERSEKAEADFEIISSRLHPRSRSFTDREPMSTNYYRVKAVGKSGQLSVSFPTLFQLEDSIPPGAPTGLKGIIDSTGVVTLLWNRNEEKDLSGYRVFRSNFKGAEFSQVTHRPVESEKFIEQIPLENLSRQIYYKVQAIDKRFNPSEFSTVIRLLKPDVVPPVAPVIKSWSASQDSVKFSWTRSPSVDIARYLIKMKSTEDVEWKTKAVSLNDSMQYTASNLQRGEYEFTVEAVDSSGNVVSSKPLMVVINGPARKPVENVKATADRTNGEIVLTWQYDEPGLDRIIVYRGEQPNGVSLYKIIPCLPGKFRDSKVSINTTYTYYLKAIFRNGDVSPLGIKIEITY